MASVRARLGAAVSCALALTVLPTVSATAAPVPSAGTTSVAAVPATSSTARVHLSSTALRNPVVRGKAVISVAKRYAGIRYRAGGTSPRTGFDCSGYTRYVFSRLGISLPRVSRDQYRHAQHISRAKAVPGDLVFFHHGGRVYHAAIYAGGNTIWHSPYPGKRVMRERIWSSSVYFARVRV